MSLYLVPNLYLSSFRVIPEKGYFIAPVRWSERGKHYLGEAPLFSNHLGSTVCEARSLIDAANECDFTQSNFFDLGSWIVIDSSFGGQEPKLAVSFYEPQQREYKTFMQSPTRERLSLCTAKLGHGDALLLATLCINNVSGQATPYFGSLEYGFVFDHGALRGLRQFFGLSPAIPVNGIVAALCSCLDDVGSTENQICDSSVLTSVWMDVHTGVRREKLEFSICGLYPFSLPEGLRRLWMWFHEGTG